MTPLRLARRAPSMRHLQAMTLVELLISLAIVAVLIAVAVPSMYEFIMRKKVEGAADELMIDLRYARSLVAKNNQNTVIKFGKTQTDYCYVVYHRQSLLDCDCTSSPVCSSLGASSATELKTVRLPISSRVTLAPTGDSRASLQFNTPSGMPTAGTTLDITIKAPSGGEVRVTTAQTGRPQLCSVSGHNSAYPACPTASE
jgi:prepilin-type N-terminal cleavage/methylation domain-containing protein